jgi:hypothetical protein
MADSKHALIRDLISDFSIPKKASSSDEEYLIGNFIKIKTFIFFDYFIERLWYGFMLRERTSNLMR